MALEMAITQNIQYCCAIMDPSLLKMLSRYGIYFEPLGPLVSYHGVRQPCYGHIATMLETTALEHPAIWRVLSDEGRLQPNAVHIKEMQHSQAGLHIATH